MSQLCIDSHCQTMLKNTKELDLEAKHNEFN